MKNLAFLVALLLPACTATLPDETSSTSEPGIYLSAERVSAGVVRLTLDNGSRDRIGYNLCTSELQRSTSSEWIRVPGETVCTMQLATLNPGHDATYELRLPAGLSAGEYRYVAGVESPLGRTRVLVATGAFRVP